MGLSIGQQGASRGASGGVETAGSKGGLGERGKNQGKQRGWGQREHGQGKGALGLAYMKLSKLGSDDCHEEVEGEVGADDNEAKVVDDHQAAHAIQQVEHLGHGPALQRHHLQHLQQRQPNVVKGHVSLQTPQPCVTALHATALHIP